MAGLKRCKVKLIPAAANEISKAVPILMAMPSRVVDIPLIQVT
jgi:hypothetical protein